MTTYDPTPERMHVVALRDPLVEAHGHRPGSPYLEAVYVGVVGPTAAWLWQRLARTAAARPSTTLDMADLAVSLGLGERLGPNAPLSRTIGRLGRFDILRRTGDTLAVRTALPDLPARRLPHLSASALLAHQHLATTARHTGPETPVAIPDTAVAL